MDCWDEQVSKQMNTWNCYLLIQEQSQTCLDLQAEGDAGMMLEEEKLPEKLLRTIKTLRTKLLMAKLKAPT